MCCEKNESNHTMAHIDRPRGEQLDVPVGLIGKAAAETFGELRRHHANDKLLVVKIKVF